MSTLDGSPGDVLVSFSLASRPGNERFALRRVAEALSSAGLSDEQTARLKTAVAEATMNGIEHGNGNREELPVEIVVSLTDIAVVVSVTDQSGGQAALQDAEHPDIDLKLAGLQRARGWGLFLIKNMVDEVESSEDGRRHTVRLLMKRDSSAGASERGDGRG